MGQTRFEQSPVKIAFLGQLLDLAEIANHLADHVICQCFIPFSSQVGHNKPLQHEQAMTGDLAMIVSAIVMAARDAAADIEDASTGESLTPERARALKTLANNLYATAFQAEENDSKAVRFLCDMLGLEKLLATYEAEGNQKQDNGFNPNVSY